MTILSSSVFIQSAVSLWHFSYDSRMLQLLINEVDTLLIHLSFKLNGQSFSINILMAAFR